MTYRMFIDDERFPPDDGWIIVRSSNEAKETVLNNGYPNHISFDHDLGGADTSMNFLHWLLNKIMDDDVNLPFTWYVHSQNPIGKQNIESLIYSFERIKKCQ